MTAELTLRWQQGRLYLHLALPHTGFGAEHPTVTSCHPRSTLALHHQPCRHRRRRLYLHTRGRGHFFCCSATLVEESFDHPCQELMYTLAFVKHHRGSGDGGDGHTLLAVGMASGDGHTATH